MLLYYVCGKSFFRGIVLDILNPLEDKEFENNAVAVRGSSGRGQIGVMSIDDFAEKIMQEINSKGQQTVG